MITYWQGNNINSRSVMDDQNGLLYTYIYDDSGDGHNFYYSQISYNDYANTSGIFPGGAQYNDWAYTNTMLFQTGDFENFQTTVSNMMFNFTFGKKGSSFIDSATRSFVSSSTANTTNWVVLQGDFSDNPEACYQSTFYDNAQGYTRSIMTIGSGFPARDLATALQAQISRYEPADPFAFSAEQSNGSNSFVNNPYYVNS